MNQTIVSIGIDVSKKYLNICFLGTHGKALKQFRVFNSVPGINALIKQIEISKKNQPIIIEATGDYHLLTCVMLSENQFNVKEINPIIFNKYLKASIRKCKTDKKDAFNLAKIGILYLDKLAAFSRSRKSVLLRKKISLLNSLTKRRQGMKLSLNSHIETVKKLGSDMHNDSSIIALENVIKELEKAMKQLESEIDQIIKSDNSKEVRLLAKTVGVSEKSSGILMNFLANKQFDNRGQLAAFAGLDTSVRESGSSVNGKRKLSKRGNAILRKTLVQVAWGLKMHNEAFQKLAAYYQSKGRHYFEILVILARKFLYVAYGMLKHNRPFDPNKIVIPS